MASTSSPTATLCHWVRSTHYNDLPAEVRQETVTLLLPRHQIEQRDAPEIAKALTEALDQFCGQQISGKIS
jgi:hypothetical protein